MNARPLMRSLYPKYSADRNLTLCVQNIREKHYPHSQLSHILTNISKQHIFNYLSEINIFIKL